MQRKQRTENKLRGGQQGPGRIKARRTGLSRASHAPSGNPSCFYKQPRDCQLTARWHLEGNDSGNIFLGTCPSHKQRMGFGVISTINLFTHSSLRVLAKQAVLLKQHPRTTELVFPLKQTAFAGLRRVGGRVKRRVLWAEQSSPQGFITIINLHTRDADYRPLGV